MIKRAESTSHSTLLSFADFQSQGACLLKLVSVTQYGNWQSYRSWQSFFSAWLTQLFHYSDVTTVSRATSCHSLKCWTVFCQPDTLCISQRAASYSGGHGTTERTGNTSSKKYDFWQQTGAEECGTNQLLLVTVTTKASQRFYLELKSLNIWHIHTMMDLHAWNICQRKESSPGN